MSTITNLFLRIVNIFMKNGKQYEILIIYEVGITLHNYLWIKIYFLYFLNKKMAFDIDKTFDIGDDQISIIPLYFIF